MEGEEQERGRRRVLAFAMPQAITENEDYNPFLSLADGVERETGLDFLAELPDDMEHRIEAENATDAW